ncbi:Glutathione S-transferase 1 [Hyphodiscus hymeniophilus]|uniref:glutathione transferase n=1 Tax=Hyphodiscus hymeniophilus TaxID=353542 RepID=A0A9P6VFJ3_9HELO|nr:Glutathione S-transferase 1 [Hyphodiscus hymeniophilus]
MSTTASADQTKVKLYWLEQSRSQRILWLLEELKVPYELEIFHRNKETHLAPPELKKVHALGKSPVISVTPAGSNESTVIAESAFIVEYLLDHFGRSSTLLPKRYKEGQEGRAGGETEEWLRFRYFMHYAEGSLMGFMMLALVVSNIQNAPVPFFIKPVTRGIANKIHSGYLGPNFKTHFAFLEEQLKTSPEKGQYLCGPRLTGADILLSFPLIAGKGRSGLTKEDYPTLWAYVERIEAEPGYLTAVEKIKAIDGKFEASI